MSDKWSLQAIPYSPGYRSDGFYIGESYFRQRKRYAMVSLGTENAKTYSSHARAINACKKLNKQFVNYTFVVKKLSEKEESK